MTNTLSARFVTPHGPTHFPEAQQIFIGHFAEPSPEFFEVDSFVASEAVHKFSISSMSRLAESMGCEIIRKPTIGNGVNVNRDTPCGDLIIPRLCPELVNTVI
jgi:hypothetical protein